MLGGSLDAAGSPEHGYVMRGGRMLEREYRCTFDLFDSIPTLSGTQTVTQETLAWNRTTKTSSKSRLFRNGHRQTAPGFGLSGRHILSIERLAIEPEGMLGASTIADQFEPGFFATDFWFMWCTTFAFQPWHSAVEFKRYLVRFAHMVGGFGRLEGIMRTVYNQYDSMVRPLEAWLTARGVVFALDTCVRKLMFTDRMGAVSVRRIDVETAGFARSIEVCEDDLVIVTLGSMTAGSSLGEMDRPPVIDRGAGGGTWALWKSLSAGQPQFGRPCAFTGDIDRSKWVSFTTTLSDPMVFDRIRDLTGNVPGEGGLITFPQSAWLASIVIPHQPHFLGQPENVYVFWGYGLTVDTPGNFVGKSMSECTGREIMTEILGHLGLVADTPAIMASAICIPCMMPYITSQFMPRGKGDRPQVVPEGAINFAFTGQYVELPDDVVFTVEYSIRSAAVAVYTLLGLKREPPAVYKGHHDPRVLYTAYRALHDIAA